MAAMKPRTGDGPMEAVKEGRLIIVRVPLEGGGRLVVSVNDAEAKELHDVLSAVVSAAVPLAVARQCFAPVALAYCSSNFATALPLLDGLNPQLPP